MRRRISDGILVAVFAVVLSPLSETSAAQRSTEVSIRGDSFLINGKLTYEGRSWQGKRIEGLLLNARLVQGIFDDLNPETVGRWAYSDTQRWDPDRNTREFAAAMPKWHNHGLLCFTINLQGGSPQGYSKEQPWRNSAITPEGSLRPDYMARLKKILDRADELGMVVILGMFYFGQDERLRDEAAVVHAVDAATDWICGQGYRSIRHAKKRSSIWSRRSPASDQQHQLWPIPTYGCRAPPIARPRPRSHPARERRS